MPARLRPVRPADLARIVDLNNAAYPAVPIGDAAELGRLVELASLALVAEDAGAVIGFLIAVDPGSEYESENYRFFSERDPDFLYIDRIVIEAGARGGGVGRMLYDAVFAKAAADGRREVTCEVNLQPPNPESLAFHTRLGFERVGEQSTKGGAFTVALLSAPVRAESAA